MTTSSNVPKRLPYRMAIPEPLWRLAANVAKQYGLARVARLLRLDYYSLKERLEGMDRDSIAASEARPAFIELVCRAGFRVHH